MRVFISSLIKGYERYRDAAAAAAEALDFQVVRAESFSASPSSPHIACLEGVRSADIVIALLGPRYGHVQPSGLSATHEEIEEAKETKTLFVFIEKPISPEDQQRKLISAAQDWATGTFTDSFNDEESLRRAITKALHRWSLAQASATTGTEDIVARAVEALATQDTRRRNSSAASVGVALAGSSSQPIIRPSELEDPKFQSQLQQQVLFGEPAIFAVNRSTDTTIDGHALILAQGDQFVSLNEDGTIIVKLELAGDDQHGLAALIEEDIFERLLNALRFSNSLLHNIDASEKISRVCIAATIFNPGFGEWRTRAQHSKKLNSMTLNQRDDERLPVTTLSPPLRSRSALRLQAAAIANDLLVLLRRNYRS